MVHADLHVCLLDIATCPDRTPMHSKPSVLVRIAHIGQLTGCENNDQIRTIKPTATKHWTCKWNTPYAETEFIFMSFHLFQKMTNDHSHLAWD